MENKKSALSFKSLKEYDDHLKNIENDKKRRLNKLRYTIRNKNSNEILTELSYLVIQYHHQFNENDNFLDDYLFENDCIDEVVIRMILSMNHKITQSNLSSVLILKQRNIISSDLCELFYDMTKNKERE